MCVSACHSSAELKLRVPFGTLSIIAKSPDRIWLGPLLVTQFYTSFTNFHTNTLYPPEVLSPLYANATLLLVATVSLSGGGAHKRCRWCPHFTLARGPTRLAGT